MTNTTDPFHVIRGALQNSHTSERLAEVIGPANYLKVGIIIIGQMASPPHPLTTEDIDLLKLVMYTLLDLSRIDDEIAASTVAYGRCKEEL